MHTKKTCYWTDISPQLTNATVEELPSKTDIVVIGAGVTGLSAARRLADLGRSVVVIDAMELGEGASSINGGQIGYGLKTPMRVVIKKHGLDVARRLWDAALEGIDLIEGFALEDDFDAGFRRTGAVSLGYRESDISKAHKTSAFYKETFGFKTTVVEGADLETYIGSDLFTVALVDSATAAIDPAKLTLGLARAVARRGVQIVERCNATSLSRSGEDHIVETSKGVVRASSVLMATNGYTPKGLLPGLLRQIIPIGSYMVATVPIEEELIERLLPGDHVYWTQKRFLNYFRKSDDNRLLFGGRPSMSSDLDLDDVVESMNISIARLFPELSGIEFTHVWGGRLGATFDLLPHLGQIDDVWYAAGYGGHGMTLAAHLGTEAGGLIAGEKDESPFLGLPQPTRPYYWGDPWFLPAGGVLFRALDKIGR